MRSGEILENYSMEECCTVNQKSSIPVCPRNQVKGKSVDLMTVQAMVRDISIINNHENFYVCESSNCPVAYYSEQTQIEENMLREKIFAKHPNTATQLVCYCFQHSVADIQTTPTQIVNSISFYVKAKQCACQFRNPKGKCCLGDVAKVAKASPK